MNGWQIVYGIVFDVLWFGAIVWLLFGGGLRRVMGIGSASTLPAVSPPVSRTADYPEFRDRDRR